MFLATCAEEEIKAEYYNIAPSFSSFSFVFPLLSSSCFFPFLPFLWLLRFHCFFLTGSVGLWFLLAWWAGEYDEGMYAEGMNYFDQVLYCTVLYCTVLYCTVLYCTALLCASVLMCGSLLCLI